MAIFGAVLIFILGIMIRYALNFNYVQNQQLAAMRTALSMSYQASWSDKDATRNVASVLYIEDRKDAENSGMKEHLSVSRTPFIMSGSGAFTRNLMMGLDWNDPKALPMMDVFVNGQQFTFTQAGFMGYVLSTQCVDRCFDGRACEGICDDALKSSCHLQCYDDSGCGSYCRGVVGGLWRECSGIPPLPPYPGACLTECQLRCANGRDDRCRPATSCPAGSQCSTGCRNQAPNPSDCRIRCAGQNSCDQNLTCPVTYQDSPRRLDWNDRCFYANNRWYGCYILYSRIPRSDKKFCASDVEPCNAGRRFDLDRDPTTGCTDSDCAKCTASTTPACPAAPYWADIPGNQYATFSWQWLPVPATTKYINFTETGTTSVDIDGDLKEESIMEIRDSANRFYTQSTRYDPDDESMDPIKNEKHVSQAYYMDNQLGDLDFSYNTWDALGKRTPKEPRRDQAPAPKKPGLREDSKIYTNVNGAYLLNEAGKLYNDSNNTNTKQYVRDTTKYDTFDMVERSIQLSNDTGRFCDVNGNPSGNNVEACGDCYHIDKKSRTCFDKQSKILYIRSRIEDKRGRKWITDVSGDKNPIKGPLGN